jgi:AcrR family transcriptional regulator
VGSGEGEERAERVGELGPLPGGHHGLSRQQIVDSQRERLLAAIAAEVAEVGYREVRIRGLMRRAGVSSRDFYQHFEGKEDCFLAAFEAVRDYLEGRIAEAAAGEPDWPHQVVAALRVALEFFASDPELARLCLIEPVSATPKISIRFREVVLSCVPAFARGRELLDDPTSLPPNTEDSLLGGVVSLASRKIVTGEAERLPELLPDLLEFVLSPYLGDERAAELAAGTTAG